MISTTPSSPIPLTIIGGGLAGLALGVGLRQHGIPCTLHEAGDYPRHRVCGEFICGISDHELDQLGILDLLNHATTLRSCLWARHDLPLFIRILPQQARGISRHWLDHALIQRFRHLGGMAHTRSRFPKSVEMPAHVWTCGRPSQKTSTWIGLKAHFSHLSLTADLEMHLGTHGYIGLSAIENNQVNACGLFHLQKSHGGGPDALFRYLEANQLRSLRQRLKSATLETSSFCGVSHFQLGYQIRPPKQLCLGDAFAMIPPFTGNGMSMALESAAIALPFLIRYCHQQESWEKSTQLIHDQLHQRFKTRMRGALTLHPLLINNASQKLLALSAKQAWFPFSSLFSLLR